MDVLVLLVSASGTALATGLGAIPVFLLGVQARRLRSDSRSASSFLRQPVGRSATAFQRVSRSERHTLPKLPGWHCS